MTLSEPPEQTSWPAGGGAMGAMVRTHDWASTPLGPLGNWPATLKVATSLALDCGFPMNVLWGPDLIQIYNDGFRDVIGEKHPAALGQTARECCPEIWDTIDPLLNRVWSGETITLADQPLRIARHGSPEEAYFTLSFSPLRDESGAVAGVLATVFETTERVRADTQRRDAKACLQADAMREAFRARLADRLRELDDPVEVQAAATTMLGEFLKASRVMYGQVDRNGGEYFEVYPDFHREGLPSAAGRYLFMEYGAYVAEAMRAGRTLVVEDVNLLPDQTPRERELYATLGIRAYVAAALVMRGQFSAFLAAADSSPRTWTPDEVALVEHTAERTWTAMERGRAEARLRESEERLRFVIEGSRLGTWESDFSTGEMKWSDRTLALFGLAPGTEMNPQRFMESIHPEDRDRIAAAIRRALDQNAEYESEYRCIWPDGSVHWVHSRGRRRDDPSGRALRISGISFDITDRKRAEDALRESEERLRVVIEAAKLATWDWDTVTGKLVLSDRCFALFGLPPGARVTFESFLAAVHPDDRDRIVQAVHGSDTSDFQMELRSVWPDGSSHWVDIRGRRYVDQSGRVVRVSGIGIDIDDRKRAEEALRESEERLRFVMDSAKVGTWDWNMATGELVWSDRSFELFGLEPGTEMNPDRFYAAVHPDDVDRINATLQRALELNVEYEVELRCIWPDGSVHWIHSRGRHYRGASGRAVRVIGVAFDVTERKRAEAAVRDSEERLRLFFDNVREYALVQTDVEGRVTTWNPGAERMFGYSGAEILGQPVSQLFTLEEREAGTLPKELARVGRGERSHGERWMMRKDGSRFWVSWVTEAIHDAAGRLRGFSKVIHDETERRRANEVTLQRQKLQSVGLLAGGIAHDFNNLLTGITGNASLLLEQVPPGAVGRVRQILSSAERAAHLTRQLLAYSGKGQFVVEEVDISEAVNAVSGLVQFSIPKGVQLALAVQTRLPCVEVDPNQLQQILMNLVINAGEAIGEGHPGKITVATGMSDVDESFVDATGQEVQPGRYVWIEVRDTGIGIAEEDKTRIFEPFFTTKFTGRGMGLAAVAGIVRAQKGAITVESKLGRGSTFRVYLPATSKHVAPEQPVAAARATVLVVDDEFPVRDVATAVLSRRGYRVLTATDGREALALFARKEESIDAVVLDVVMPVMGAHEFLPVLRTHHPHVRVLLTSGYSESEARRLAGAGPESAFLPKPFTADQIATAVDELLGVRPKDA